ncbi:hypothetical protein B0T11DRAFT_318104 [Plectosphaerella cucumerina]|uniref:Uncharacterized protein n=1 Tax=Plectosphaerella cucumerina TaxID=40658 RepID=A0A8K0X379_9PEZI|nr:hypothetical protein B0T11DRAFT_318104 [Plectosphaerella cucumerina]
MASFFARNLCFKLSAPVAWSIDRIKSSIVIASTISEEPSVVHSCLNCTARDTPCPGYGDVFDKAHRDETAKVRKLHCPRRQASGSILSATKSPDHNAISGCCRTPRRPLESPENDALGFFFVRYGQSIDFDATCGIFSILPEMFAKSPMSSPLNHATRALALQVTCLHRSHIRTSMEAELYFKAVSQVKEALTDATKCKSEDLLLATLVLDAYYTIDTTFRRREHDVPQSSPHLQGSIALLQHRGKLNYRNDLAWRLLAATRNRFLRQGRHMTDGLFGIETIHNIWRYDDRRKPRGLAVEADTLAFRLSWLRNFHWALSTSSPSLDRAEQLSPGTKLDNIETLKDLVSQASCIANDCALLQSSLPIKWQPAPVPASSLAPSIQATSVYKHVIPTVYLRLSIANAINRQRLTELECISLIGNCLAQITEREEPRCTPHQNRLMPSRLLARAQVLIDDICASVPFLTGDVTADTWGNDNVLVPSMVLSSPEERGAEMALPENPTRHMQQVVASGLYMMNGTLKALLNIVGSDTIMGITGSVLRAGQVDWIVGQIDRLGAIFP